MSQPRVPDFQTDLQWEGVSPNIIARAIAARIARKEDSDWLSTLHLEQDTVMVALQMDLDLNNEGLPCLTSLIIARIAALENDPVRVSMKKKRESELAEAARLEEERQKLKARACGALKASLPIGGVLLAGAAAYSYVSPEIVSWVNQVRLDEEVSKVTAERAKWAEPVNGGPDLEGARLRFPCVKDSRTGAWRVTPIQEAWTTDDLKKEYFGVDFKPGVSRNMSIAEAGWGVTAQFTSEQMEADYPNALRAPAVEVPKVGRSYVLPTAAFIKDPDEVVLTLFTTGAFAEDGKLLTYHLVGFDGKPVCVDGPTDEKEQEAGLFMVTAELKSEFPKKKLSDFLYSIPGPDIQFEEKFEEYDLGKWYRGFYPGFVNSMDFALQQGSSRGQPDWVLELPARYLDERRFESALLDVLQNLREKLSPSVFQTVLAGIRASRMPLITYTEQQFLNFNGLGGAADIKARGAGIHLGQLTTEKTITHELIHALVQEQPDRSYDRDESRECLFKEAMTERLTIFGHSSDEGKTGYFGRVHLVDQILKRGYWDEMMEFYMNSPTRELGADQILLLKELEVEVPLDASEAHLYSVIIEAFQLHRGMSENRQAQAKSLFLLVKDTRSISRRIPNEFIEKRAFELGDHYD